MLRRTLLLILALILAGCTGGGGSDSDSDDDGVDDVDERNGRIIEITKLDGIERRSVTADVGDPDTDDDGLLDGDEMNARGTDPRDVDTDDDGLLDGRDQLPLTGDIATAWRNAGIIEVNGTFLGEFDACPTTGSQLRPNLYSSDLPIADELGDGEEMRGWDVSMHGNVRRVTSDPCSPDTDKDGLLDHEEKLAKSDPRDEDTDGDGVRDGSDADPLFDLSLLFHDLEVTGTNVSSVRIIFLLGEGAAELRWPGNATASLAVPDSTNDRERLETTFVLSAEDAQTGEPIALSEDPRGAILTIDLLAGTVSGIETDGDKLIFSGRDGAMTMRWTTERR
jgi:hypothetical protein